MLVLMKGLVVICLSGKLSDGNDIYDNDDRELGIQF